MKRFATLAVATLAFAACSENPAGIGSTELALAQEGEAIAVQEVSSVHGHYLGWLARLLDTLRTTDDPEARALLEQAHAYQDSAAAARAAGRFEAARHYHQLAFRAVLGAVIEIYPNAPDRAGSLVDNIVARIEARLGDREAPRIRHILAHVKELRSLANAATDPVDELAINLRCIQILHRLVHHVRDVRDGDHDRVADTEMQETPVARP